MPRLSLLDVPSGRLEPLLPDALICWFALGRDERWIYASVWEGDAGERLVTAGLESGHARECRRRRRLRSPARRGFARFDVVRER